MTSRTLAAILAVFLIACCVGLTGCASPKWLENRVVCTADRAEAHTISKWGPVSIGAQVAATDAAVICQGPKP